MGRVGREWLQDVLSAGWSGETDEWDIPIFAQGDLLRTESTSAVVIKVLRGFYDWKYEVLYRGGMHTVDQAAMHAWLVV